MSFLIILLLILISTFFFIYRNLTQKIWNFKKQLTFLVRNNDELKDKVLKQNISPQNSYTNISSEVIEIKYESPSFNSATTCRDCILYAAPFENSPIVSKISVNTPLEVQDTAFISNTTWYEVNIPISERINSKGWLKAESVI